MEPDSRPPNVRSAGVSSSVIINLTDAFSRPTPTVNVTVFVPSNSQSLLITSIGNVTLFKPAAMLIPFGLESSLGSEMTIETGSEAVAAGSIRTVANVAFVPAASDTTFVERVTDKVAARARCSAQQVIKQIRTKAIDWRGGLDNATFMGVLD